MSKKIFVNAKSPDETRIAVLDGNELVDFDTENTNKKHIKGNIYLARVVRVEPSLQAVFIEYGAEHNGFLPFSEIHPDYYRIPIDDQRRSEEDEDDGDDEEPEDGVPSLDSFAFPESVLDVVTDGAPQEAPKPEKKKKRRRRYSVQEVIFPKQVLLVQATKDERGSKCAAFTTYLSLAGQYCVLMPNAGERTGGISKRIQEDDTRTRLKNVVKDLKVPEKMSIIIRTAGQERTKAEIRKDYGYLMRMWDEIRAKTLESNAPLLIHEEADILVRVIRDFYNKDIESVLVDTPDAYKKIRAFMKQLSTTGVKKVKLFKDKDNVSLFNAFDIERQIVAMVTPRVPLPSGGSLVIGQTEALVAIDVNSGRATRERNLDITALKTNLEAAREIARQLRLRDLSGLIVIDFIDMSEHKHNQQVEQEFKQSVASDRARIQVGTISQFGLLELSRQRLRSSVMEVYSEICPHCQGRGMMYSRDYFVSTVLHALEKSVSEEETTNVRLYTPSMITDLLLNEHRKSVCDMETKYHCQINIQTDASLSDVDFMIDNGRSAPVLLSLVKAPDEDPQRESHFAEKRHESSEKPSEWQEKQTKPEENRLSTTPHPEQAEKRSGQTEKRPEPTGKRSGQAEKRSEQAEKRSNQAERRLEQKEPPKISANEKVKKAEPEVELPILAVEEGTIELDSLNPTRESRRRRRGNRHRRHGREEATEAASLSPLAASVNASSATLASSTLPTVPVSEVIQSAALQAAAFQLQLTYPVEGISLMEDLQDAVLQDIAPKRLQKSKKPQKKGTKSPKTRRRMGRQKKIADKIEASESPSSGALDERA